MAPFGVMVDHHATMPSSAFVVDDAGVMFENGCKLLLGSEPLLGGGVASCVRPHAPMKTRPRAAPLMRRAGTSLDVRAAQERMDISVVDVSLST
jgi:hypothetical protein